jgi:hypothetical protein
MSEMTLRQRAERAASLKKLAEEEAAPVNATLAELQKNTLALRAEITKCVQEFWALPLNTIAQQLGEFENGKPVGFSISKITAQVGAVDDTLNLPMVETRAIKGEIAAYKTFLQRLVAERGMTLSRHGGIERLATFADVLAIASGIDLTIQATWDVLFDRLLTLNCFAESELGYDESLITVYKPAPVAEPVAEVPFDLEATNLSSREGEKLAKAWLSVQYYGVEAAELFTLWINSLSSNFGYVPEERAKRAVVKFFQVHNLNFKDRRSYDRVRVALVKNGVFPSHCLTEDEVLAARLESSDLSDRNVVREFQLENQRINGN